MAKIKITENELKQIVAESVKKILNEESFPTEADLYPVDPETGEDLSYGINLTPDKVMYILRKVDQKDLRFLLKMSQNGTRVLNDVLAFENRFALQQPANGDNCAAYELRRFIRGEYERRLGKLSSIERDTVHRIINEILYKFDVDKVNILDELSRIAREGHGTTKQPSTQS